MRGSDPSSLASTRRYRCGSTSSLAKKSRFHGIGKDSDSMRAISSRSNGPGARRRYGRGRGSRRAMLLLDGEGLGEALRELGGWRIDERLGQCGDRVRAGPATRPGCGTPDRRAERTSPGAAEIEPFGHELAATRVEEGGHRRGAGGALRLRERL